MATLALRCRLANHARLPHIVRQRFFAVHVLPELQRRKRGKGVRVLAGADDDGVKFIGVVVQPAEIGNLSRLRVVLRRRCIPPLR